jgi:hypothetical protein
LAKKPRQKARPRRTIRRERRAQITRREYNDFSVRFSMLEMQANRNRIDLDIQLARIAQLQDEIAILRQNQAATALASEIPSLPLSPKQILES